MTKDGNGGLNVSYKLAALLLSLIVALVSCISYVVGNNIGISKDLDYIKVELDEFSQYISDLDEYFEEAGLRHGRTIDGLKASDASLEAHLSLVDERVFNNRLLLEEIRESHK